MAQALIGSPPILILDEPTSGLDPSQVVHFRDLLKRLAERHTILLSTHILSEVEASCSRVVVVHRGRTVAAESVDALRRRAAQVTRVTLRTRSVDAAWLRTALGNHTWATIINGHADTLTIDADAEHRGDLVTLAEQHGGLRELIEERRSLEDVFRDLIGS